MGSFRRGAPRELASFRAGRRAPMGVPEDGRCPGSIGSEDAGNPGVRFPRMPAGRDGRPLFDWLTTTTHHDLHHSQAHWNYGLYFTWWDRWMGTEHPDYHAHFALAVGKPRAYATAAK